MTDEERIARLERMVFLMLSIMNGTIFATGGDHETSRPLDAFANHLDELWRLQREMEPQPMRRS